VTFEFIGDGVGDLIAVELGFIGAAVVFDEDERGDVLGDVLGIDGEFADERVEDGAQGFAADGENKCRVQSAKCRTKKEFADWGFGHGVALWSGVGNFKFQI
jgi:hypothetical protein